MKEKSFYMFSYKTNAYEIITRLNDDRENDA